MRPAHPHGPLSLVKDDQGIFRQSEALQRRGDFSHAPVDFLDHVAVQAPLAGAGPFRGDHQRRMRRRIGQIEKEGLRPVRLDELDRPLRVAFGEQALVDDPLDHLRSFH